MTIQQTIDAIQALRIRGIQARIRVRYTDGEFCLTYSDDNEDSAYYTTDRRDALNTARAMAGY